MISGDVFDSTSPSTAFAAQFHAAAQKSDFFLTRPLRLSSGSQLEHFVFEGPHGGGEPIRIGFFAGIHGDEQSGSHALLQLAESLIFDPNRAEGYHLHFYPVCNPSGFDIRSRVSRSGKDLNREFWRGSL